MAIRTERFGLIIVKDKVPAVDVIDPTVSVVIDSIPRNLARIGPNVQVRVGRLNPIIDNGNDRRGRSTPVDIPSLWHIDIRIDQSTRLPGVVQMPKISKPRIVRRVVTLPILIEVRFDPFDLRVVLQKIRTIERLATRGTGKSSDKLIGRSLQRSVTCNLRKRRKEFLCRSPSFEIHNEFVEQCQLGSRRRRNVDRGCISHPRGLFYALE